MFSAPLDFKIQEVDFKHPSGAATAATATEPTPPSLQPSFVASVPFLPGKVFKGGLVTVTATQIQYTQKVILNFAGLSWPHVSVTTFVPAGPVPIPASLLPMT